MRVEIETDLPTRRTREPRGASAAAAGKGAAKVSQRERTARRLALAYHIDELISSGKMADLAEIARHCGVSRARVTQIHDLMSLPDQTQESLLIAAC